MFKKIKSLCELQENGFNVHYFIVPNTLNEFLQTVLNMQHCTIRYDHTIESKDLPFQIITQKDLSIQNLTAIWNQAKQKEYQLIISNGIQYDPIQTYNMTVKFEKNGDFIFEASGEKVPLRHMYRYPLLSCAGNLTDSIQEWQIIHQLYGLNKCEIKKDLEQLYTHEIYGKWIELTKYPIPVGTQKEQIIFWQIVK